MTCAALWHTSCFSHTPYLTEDGSYPSVREALSDVLSLQDFYSDLMFLKTGHSLEYAPIEVGSTHLE
jgi:hypothetical protein